MGVNCLGIVATGLASSQNFIDVVFTSPVPRSSPTLTQHILLVVQASGPPTIGGGSSIASDTIGDDATPQPCYGNLYGIGNQYLEIASFPRAGVSSVPTFPFNWYQSWLGCILHDIKIGDKVTLTYTISGGEILDNLRAYAVQFTGIIAYPKPFPFHLPAPVDGSGWIQARNFDWNKFEPGQPNACFDGSYNAAGIVPGDGLFVTKGLADDEDFFGTNHWTNDSPYAISELTGANQPGLSSFSFYSPFSLVNSWFNTGSAHMAHALGFGVLPAAANDTTRFAGCFDVAPSFASGTSSMSVATHVVRAGPGPPYDNPKDCLGTGIWLPHRHRPEYRDGSPLSDPGNTGLRLDHHFRADGATGPTGTTGTAGLRFDKTRFRAEHDGTTS